MPSTLAIDFDGVIHKYREGWQNGSIYDDLSDGSVDFMRKLIDEGYPIFICSSRDAKQIANHMNKKFEDMVFEVIPEDTEFWNKLNRNDGKRPVGVTNRKLPAKLYMDDAAYKVPFKEEEKDWEKMRKEVKDKIDKEE